MEIERKYLIDVMPENLEQYKCLQIEQAYLCTNPVVRIRREDDEFYMTYKGSGFMTRAEHNLPLDFESYYHLLGKCDGNVLTKKRYLIPIKPKFNDNIPQPPLNYQLVVELDVFEGAYAGLLYAEVEFGSVEAANAFIAPDWFGEEVTYDKAFHNSHLSASSPEEVFAALKARKENFK